MTKRRRRNRKEKKKIRKQEANGPVFLTTLQFANCPSVCPSALDLNLFFTYRAVNSADRRGLLPRCAPRYTFFVTRLIDGEKSKLVVLEGVQVFLMHTYKLYIQVSQLQTAS